MKLVYSISLGFVLFFLSSFSISSSLAAESVLEKSKQLRVELLQYLRQMRSMVNNFPCSPFPQCFDGTKPSSQETAPEQTEGSQEKIEIDFVKKYEEAQRIYQEGLIYYFEANFLNAYARFIAVQKILDNALEELSQSYLERTGHMLREAIEKKIPEDPDDKSLSTVILQYGPDTLRRRIFKQDRETPQTQRSYKAKETRWLNNKFRLEGNLRMGYEHLGLAKKARLKAFRVVSAANVLPVFDPEEEKQKNQEAAQAGEAEQAGTVPPALKKQEITLPQRRKRITYYLKSIHLCRKAKANAGFIFMLKYPYDNYALQNPYGQTEKGIHKEVEVPAIEDVRMNWSQNPYVNLKKLHPVYDLRVTAEFRRDLVDARDEIYKDQMNRLVRLELLEKKPESFQKTSGQDRQQPQ